MPEVNDADALISVRAHLARLMRTDTSMTAGHVVPRADRNFGGKRLGVGKGRRLKIET